MLRISSIEILENRIAPAVFFVGANSLSVRNAAGEDAQDSDNESNARDDAGATAAVLLSKGDILLLDTNNDNQVSDTDIVLARVTGGKAMFFLTEGVGETVGGFGIDEITGLAVSHGFKGEIKTDVRGSIVTALDPAGEFLSTGLGELFVVPSSVSSLKVDGYVDGWLLAGESISNVTIGAPLHGPIEQYSIEGIATGTDASMRSVSFNGGSTTFGTIFVFGDNKNGGNINNVALTNGASVIAAGDGADSATAAKAGNGGNISKVTVLSSPFHAAIIAGDGGAANGSGKSGSGGNLTDIEFTQQGANAAFSFQAGNAGTVVSGKGGSGGSVTKLELEFVSTAQYIEVIAGDGAGGGRGGSISNAQLSAADVTEALRIEGGSGGAGIGRGKGGNAGPINNLDISAKSVAGTVTINGGSGGSGGAEGGAGAAGGAVQKLELQLTGNSGGLNLVGGAGGSAVVAPGAGGVGGKIAKVTIETSGLNSVNILGGPGGIGRNASGANGGAVQDLSFKNTGPISGTLNLSAGSGGEVNEGKGTAGAGGALQNLKLNNSGGLSTVNITSGTGGTFATVGKGGRSGQVSGITIDSSAEISGNFTIHSAQAGGPSFFPPIPESNIGNGATSGDIKKVAINDFFGASGVFSIFAGGGKSGKGEKGKGGNTGSISGVKLNAPDATVKIGAADFVAPDGGMGTESVGGSGGNISKIRGSVGTLDIIATAGGAGATGGRGGSISDVNITEVESFVHLIAAGDGGAGTSRAGAGGSVKKVKIAGDIGNFDAPFANEPSSPLPSMGGLIAGKKGEGPGGATNGSILTVSAERIAAILAGTPAPNEISIQNAVERIAGIRASVIGADINGNGAFDFTEGSWEAGYQVGMGDSAIDGLVIAKANRFKLPVTPLKLIVVGGSPD